MNTNQNKRNSTRLWRQFVALGALSVLTVALTLGCSDDNPTGSVKPIGNVSDSTFQLVSNQITPTDISADGMDWVGLLMGELPGFAPSSSNGGARPFLARGMAQGNQDTVLSITFVIDSTSGWIVFNATIANFQDTFIVVDSMRFSDLTNTPFIPSDSLNIDSISKLDIRVHGSATIVDSTEFVGTGALHSSLTVSVIGRNPNSTMDTLRINATETDTLSGTAFDSANGQCDINVTMTSSFTNVVALADDSTGACPLAGQARISASVSADCTGNGGTLTFQDTWTVNATFNGGNSATIVFENSTTRWEVTEPCNDNPPPVASSLHRMVGLAQVTVE